MLDDRIPRIEDRLRRVEDQVAGARVEIHEARKDITEVLVIIQGPPREESIRGRLHVLENSEATAKAAEAALTASKAFYEQSSDKRFSRREKWMGILLAFSLLASQWLEPLIRHH